MTRKHKCYNCEETFESPPDWTEEDAINELKRNFNMEKPDDCVVICDDCYKSLPLPN
jgi:hypothetical protein